MILSHLRRSLCFLALAMFLLAGVYLVSTPQTAWSDDEVDPSKLPAPATETIDFVKHIQPIFQAKCYSCHGPEESEGGLRFDVKTSVFEGGDNGEIVVDGKSAESRLIHVVAGLDEDLTMPPEDEGTQLNKEQVALLRAWIDQGMDWPASVDGADGKLRGADHWAFQPIANPAVPKLSSSWVRNGIDAFILRRLQKEKVEPSKEADRSVLIRRVFLDLIGLPPNPQEWAKWKNEKQADWYEQMVDSLLASPHYGERWGRHWLDQARYADSDGFEKDLPRPHAWRWRDWVINSLNSDLPFDQFTMQQLAGDLMPDATKEQVVATGFNRNTLINREGGVDQEEDRVKRTIDRTGTLGSVWMGLTVECGQCHSHKYDPLTQREYYGLFAFFNSLKEPDVAAPYRDQVEAYEAKKSVFDKKHAKYLTAISDYKAKGFPEAQFAWENRIANNPPVWSVLWPSSLKAEDGAELALKEDGSVLASGELPSRDTYLLEAETDLSRVASIRLEVLTDPSLPKRGPGRADNGNFLLSSFKVEVAPVDGSAPATKLEFSGARTDFAQKFYEVTGAVSDVGDGWALLPRIGQRHVAVFEVKDPIEFSGPVRLKIKMGQRYGGARTIGRFRLSVTGNSGEVDLEAISSRITKIVALTPEQRNDEQRTQLTEFYESIDPDLIRLQQVEIADAGQAPTNPNDTIKAQVVEEMADSRQTHLLIRGDFLRKGPEIEPITPAVLPPLKPRGETPDRLDLAKWLVDPAHPLTARVAVNRVWQQYFGRGIVATGHDFGTQGDPPSHAELLDYLATQFRDQGWSFKALHRLIVTSATYRQSSHARPELLERDPYNALLSRQNRLRVDAEVVRDLALATSGLLNNKVGGQSVRPQQPKGIEKLGYAGGVTWETSLGADRFRRGLYTFFQRTVPYPMLMTFDAPDSNTTCTQRDRSNTPLQALTLWNDLVFTECAQALGRRIAKEAPSGATSEERVQNRVRYAFQVALSRDPSQENLDVMVSLYQTMLEKFQGEESAEAFLAVGDLPGVDGVTTAELAAWCIVGRVMINLDEFITKE